jgi:hypothetical protein
MDWKILRILVINQSANSEGPYRGHLVDTEGTNPLGADTTPDSAKHACIHTDTRSPKSLIPTLSQHLHVLDRSPGCRELRAPSLENAEHIHRKQTCIPLHLLLLQEDCLYPFRQGANSSARGRAQVFSPTSCCLIPTSHGGGSRFKKYKSLRKQAAHDTYYDRDGLLFLK